MQKERENKRNDNERFLIILKTNESYKVENDSSSINPAPHHLFPMHPADFPIPKYLRHHFLWHPVAVTF